MFKIREYREKIGYTQEQLSEIVGISRPYLSALENGRKKNPSITLLKKMAKVLNTTVNLLITDEEYGSKEILSM